MLGAAPEADALALIRAHPELAGKAAIAGTLTSESLSEQAGAGLDRLTAEDYARFQTLNAAYGARFGFPFIICVRLNDKTSILAAMALRLANAPATEVAEAVRQIGLISRLRLFDAVEAPVPAGRTGGPRRRHPPRPRPDRLSLAELGAVPRRRLGRGDRWAVARAGSAPPSA